MQLVGLRNIQPRVALGHDNDRSLISKRLNELDRAFSTYS
jgi:hypothetical protein